MSIVGLVLLIAFIGVILWLVNAYVPMDAKIKQILNAVVILCLILFLISLFVPGLFNARVPIVH
jgi:hypothetical protein